MYERNRLTKKRVLGVRIGTHFTLPGLGAVVRAAAIKTLLIFLMDIREQ